MTHKVIHRFPIASEGVGILMPAGAEILTVGIRPMDGVPSIWVLVDLDAPIEERVFVVYGTGKHLPDDPGKYVGTFYNGPLVWHLFERIKPGH